MAVDEGMKRGEVKKVDRQSKSGGVPSLMRSLSRPSKYSSVMTPVGIMLSVTAFTYLSPSNSRLT